MIPLVWYIFYKSSILYNNQIKQEIDSRLEHMN